MKKPGWVTTVGVLGVILGVMGVVGSLESFFMSRILAVQRQMIDAMASQGGTQAGTQAGQQMLTGLAAAFSNPPSWFKVWSIGAGLAGLVVHGAYLFASARLLGVKPGAARMFCSASGGVIALVGAHGVASSMAFPRLGGFMRFGMLFSLSSYVALLSVTLASDKSAFRTTPPPLPQSTNGT